MKITCISDLHGLKPILNGGDLLIVAGDLTARGQLGEYTHFLHWLRFQPYRHKVVIAGNHDGLIQEDPDVFEAYCKNSRIEYLQDSSCIIEGIKIYGMPWTPPFLDWHFMAPYDLMEKKVASIPYDVDVLVTHGPPLGTLDLCASHCLGCPLLANRLLELPNLKLHVFGHIHSGYGQKRHEYGQNVGLLSVNCSLMTNEYDPDNEPTYVTLKEKTMDKQINKIKKSLDKGEKDTKKLLKMDKKQDKKIAKCEAMPKKK